MEVDHRVARRQPRSARLPSGTSAAALAVRTAAVAVAASAVVAAVPFLALAYRAPALHVMLETANAGIALLVLYLVYGRFRRNRRLQELLLLIALGVVATANLVLTAVPDAVTPERGDQVAQWAPLAVRVLGTSLFAAAALTPVRVRVRGRTAGLAVLGAVLLVVGIGFAGTSWADLLPRAVDAAPPSDTTRPTFSVHPAVLGAHGLGVALYGLAAAAFARQSDRTGDRLLRWVAAGCVLAATSRLHYLAVPSLYTEYVYTGDLFRLGFYVCLLVGAAREVTSYWGAKAEAAVLEDRRRMARDLHDGLIQELSYIAAQSRSLTRRPGDVVLVERINGAAGRAIDESRRAVAALTRPDDAPLPTVLRRSLEELADRHDVTIVAEIDHATTADGPMTEALLRIAVEAVGNAVRHAAASRIHVRLDAVPLSLCVSDDGRGFAADTPRAQAGGFGLTSMRERAEGIGATLHIDSRPGEGTTVRVGWT